MAATVDIFRISLELSCERLYDWRVFPLELANPSVAGSTDRSYQPKRDGPVFYRGSLSIDSNTARGASGHLPDTYINVRGWGKGLAFVNGFNLGWYWPSAGPQGAQYVPGPLLREGANEIVLLEVETVPNAQSVTLTSEADLRGPTKSLLLNNHGPEMQAGSAGDYPAA